MNDIRRTILWVIFGFSIVLLWDQWQLHNGRQATFFPSPIATAAKPVEPVSEMPASTPEAGAEVPQARQVVAGAGENAVGAIQATASSLPRERVTVSTDVLKLTFDTEGGSLVHSEFLRHHESHDPQTPVVLFDESRNRVYLSQTGLIGGADLPNHKTVMKLVSSERELKAGADTLVVQFESQVSGGVQLVKTYTFRRGSYAVDVKHEVRNLGQDAVSPQLYLQLVRDGNKMPGESSFYSTFTGPAIYTEAKKYQKVEFSDIEKGKAEFDKESTNGYVAMVQHYFASAWLLADGVQRELFARKVSNNLYAVGMITPLQALAPGANRMLDAQLYVGPQEEKQLEALAPGLELVKDYGWLTILAKPLYWLLDKLHGLLHNWGWSIVALVVLLKMAFYWLNAKAYASMAKMKAIAPRITEMRERLKDKPQQMQQEMMRIYREEKVNPLGGCLPIMIQIPVFIALYWVLLSSVEMRNAPWILWIKDLSTEDPYYILPLVMTLTTILQTALNPLPPDPLQAKLMWIMPLVFSVMFFFFPAGLVLYWVTNNILSIAQQALINSRMGVPLKITLPKFK
jgi:YidC/Oxa1 family membrane protein insertase